LSNTSWGKSFDFGARDSDARPRMAIAFSHVFGEGVGGRVFGNQVVLDLRVAWSACAARVISKRCEV